MSEQTQRYFIRLSYLGTGFHGWQIQPNAPTIQQTLEEAMGLVLRENVRLTGAGRTDTGVHARVFYAHFDSGHQPGSPDTDRLVFKLNRMLTPGIAIQGIFPVAPDAHARFDALSRTYHYYIGRKKDPFRAGRVWLLERDLDVESMRQSAGLLARHEDFSCFARSNTQVKTHLCTVYLAEWEQEQDHDLLCFRIKANRFLRNMVRAMVGTMVDVGLKKMSPGALEAIIRQGDRRKAGLSAPACGLFLEDIEYPYPVGPRV